MPTPLTVAELAAINHAVALMRRHEAANLIGTRAERMETYLTAVDAIETADALGVGCLIPCELELADEVQRHTTGAELTALLRTVPTC